jgi:Cu-Zn family superoxide dismutase
MRVRSGLKTALICAMFTISCENSESGDAKDSGMASDGSVQADAGGGGDSGNAADSGTNVDSGGDTGSDAGSGDDVDVITASDGGWTIVPNPYGDGGANPATDIQGSATATRDGDGGMQLALQVSGLPPSRGFGSHLHKLTCETMIAGGHYQHSAAPPDAAADPAYANPSNEVWLDFTTDDAGAATAHANVGWIPSDGGANAIIVHDRLTGDGGLAGPKLACLPIPF